MSIGNSKTVCERCKLKSPSINEESGVKCLQTLTVHQSQMFSAKQQHSGEKLLCIIYKYKLTDVPCIFLI